MLKSDLAEYAIKKLGGEAAVKKEFAKEQLMNAISDNLTLGKLIEVAKEGDFLPILLSTPIQSIGGQAAPNKSAKSSGRITVAEKEALKAMVLDFLKKVPWSSKGIIAEGVDFEPAKLAVHLRSLKDEGKIKSSGNLSSTVYALKGEKTKAKV